MFEEIKPNLFVFYSPNQGCNAYLLVGKKTVLIDSSSQNNSQALVEGLEGIGVSSKSVDLVLFTHAHADHFSGSAPFTAAEMGMHKLDANYVNAKDQMYTASTMLGSSHFPKIKRFLSPGEKIEFKPFNLEVVHTPGHTQGSVSFFDKAQKILFSGDLLFKGGFGRFDLPSGDKQELLNSINSVKKLGFETLLPGHGLVLKEKQSENIEFALKSLSGPFI